jgi:membrane protein required for colicin V production
MWNSSMTWFDYIAIPVLVYFTIRGILSGFVRTVFSLIGIIAAFLLAGRLSSEILPFLAKVIHHARVVPVLSLVLAFAGIYLVFVFAGWLVAKLLKILKLSFADRLLGALLGTIKGVLFITFLYLLITLPYPLAKLKLRQSFTYPLIEWTLKIGSKIIPFELELKRPFSRYYPFLHRG